MEAVVSFVRSSPERRANNVLPSCLLLLSTPFVRSHSLAMATPLLDELDNPFYLPPGSVIISAHLNSLNRKLTSSRRVTRSSTRFSASRQDEDIPFAPSPLDPRYYPSSNASSRTPSPELDRPQWELDLGWQDVVQSSQIPMNIRPLVLKHSTRKAKTTNSFTDLRGPPKHSRSFLTGDDDESFTYSPRREVLRYFPSQESVHSSGRVGSSKKKILRSMLDRSKMNSKKELRAHIKHLEGTLLTCLDLFLQYRLQNAHIFCRGTLRTVYR
jgi:hypothetical protein